MTILDIMDIMTWEKFRDLHPETTEDLEKLKKSKETAYEYISIGLFILGITVGYYLTLFSNGV